MNKRVAILIIILVMLALLACGPGMMSNEALLDSVQQMTW